MQRELDATTTTRPIRIHGVNAPGMESGNAIVCQGRELPWLQDTRRANVWGTWGVTFRDVVILDAENRVLRTYNLTANDLGTPAKFAELKAILVAAAQ